MDPFYRHQIRSAMKYCHSLGDVYEMAACTDRFNAGTCKSDKECAAFKESGR